jgi:PAS domain S-box-containing protein
MVRNMSEANVPCLWRSRLFRLTLANLQPKNSADRLMKNFASPKVSIGFMLTLLVLITNAVVAYQRIGTVAENNRSATYSQKVLTTLEQMLSTLKDVETGQREYLLTNNPQYLVAHRIDIVQLRTQLTSLMKLKSSSESMPTMGPNVPPKHQQQLVTLEQQIVRHLSEVTATIDRRQAQILTPARQIVLSQQGQQSIDRIRNITTALDRSERTILDRLQTESRRSLADTKIAFGISGLLDLLLLAILYGLVNWDLINKQRAESTLRDYVTEFEELYHSAPCGYHSLDATGKVLRINRTELQMLGYQESEIIGCKNIVDLLTTASIQKLDDNFATIKTRGWISDLEFEMVRKDGQIIPVSATVVAIKDERENYLGSRVTIIDINERVRLRQQTQLSAEISQKIRQSLQLEEILQTAVEEVQKLLGVDRVLIFRFEADGSGTVVQEQVVSGYLRVLGSSIIDPCFDRSYHSRYAQGRIYTVADITQAGFEPCYVEFLQKFAVKASSIVPIYLRDELWGLLVVHQCRSPRQWHPREVEILIQLATQIGIALAQSQLLEQEQLQRQELARSNAELEQFAHIASHDLQEPLRMVISYLQLLSRRYQGKLDPDADEFIEYAVDGAVRMQALIQALLGYARVSSRKQPFDRVDCNLVLQDAISNLYVAITESSATISAAPLPVVWGDATQLTLIFQNLIANAIKFRRDVPPKIQISVKPVDAFSSIDSCLLETEEIAATPSGWCFAVADNGIGIESQYLDRIFAIFQRLHTRVTYPGTGIGLAICKKIIERHGGTIWVESTPERSNSVSQQPLSIQSDCCGSIFYFIIPAVDSISPQHAHQQPHH